ncbi:MAG: right-handed parallel beta-helix repeat-containing protein, partial [Armatimonadota bacterium]
MKSWLVVVLVVVVSAVLCGSAFATDYFVATWGDDDNPGTIDLPFATVTKGTSVAVAGDTINVRAGDYAEDRLDFYSDGNPDAYITLQSYDGDRAAHITDGVYVHGRKYIKIIGMEISGGTNVLHIDPGDPKTLVPRSEYIYVQRCYVHDPSGSGDVIKVNQSDYVFIEDCEVANATGDEAVDFVWVNYSEVRRCYIHDYEGCGFFTKGGCLYDVLE